MCYLVVHVLVAVRVLVGSNIATWAVTVLLQLEAAAAAAAATAAAAENKAGAHAGAHSAVHLCW